MKSRVYTQEAERIFPLYAVTVGYDEPQAPRTRPEGLPDHQIFFVNRGHGILQLGEHTYKLTAGDLFFLRADEPHSYRGLDENFYTSWIRFFGAGAEALLSFYGVDGSAAYFGKHCGAFQGAMEGLYTGFHSESSLPQLMANAYRTVVCFFDAALGKEPTSTERVKAYLEQHFAEPVTLSDILREVSCARSKLCRDFKAEYGESIFEMLTRIRLENAKIQLQGDTALKVKDVALACGFSDCSYFCRMYRRFFGKSPKSN